MMDSQTIEGLLGFNPPPSIPLPDEIAGPIINQVKGRRFGQDDATFVSRYGNTDHEDHPLKWLEFSNDGSLVRSHCPGPDDSDASVLGEFILKDTSDDDKYVIELKYGCKTTFYLQRTAVANAGKLSPFLPIRITCRRDGCPQRHLEQRRTDVDVGQKRDHADDPDGMVVLRRCTRCRQVHYCSVACQRMDWKARHRVECAAYGKRFPGTIVARAHESSCVLPPP